MSGELATIGYPEKMRDVEFTYDRLGRKKTVTDEVGIRTFGYNDDGGDSTPELRTETIALRNRGTPYLFHSSGCLE